MYKSHFHLNDRPFASAANPEHYYPASSIEQAREVIALNVERSSGASIVTGPVGSGKTLLCQLLANQFDNELPVCLISGGRLSSREELLQAILHELELPYHGQNEGDLRLTLNHHVTGKSCMNGILLIVDEADHLDTDTLEEIRALTDLVKDGQSCCRLVLAGAHSLEENLAAPRLESLNQRIVGRMYLDNFSQEETAQYISARITACGGDAPSIFTDDAWSMVWKATNGVPRLVNQICDHAMLMSAVAGIDRIDGRVIEEAWADLQQIPVPGSESTIEVSESESTVIEFGSLDDDDEQSGPEESIEIVLDEDPSYDHSNEEAIEIVINDELINEELTDDETIDSAQLAAIQRVVAELGDEASTAAGVAEIDVTDDQIEINIDSESEVTIEDGYEEDQEYRVVGGDEEAQNEQPDRHSPFADEQDYMEEHDEVAGEDRIEIDLNGYDVSEGYQGTEIKLSIREDETDTSDIDAAETNVTDIDSSTGEYDHEEESVVVQFDDPVEQADEVSDEVAEDAASEVHIEEYEVRDESANESVVEFGQANEAAVGFAAGFADNTVETEPEYQLAAEEPDNQWGESEESFEPAAEQHVAAQHAAAQHVAEQGEEHTERAATGESHEHELTMDQASNPFDEEYDDEEVVIQQFISPSKIARGEYENVSSAYSQHLAAQLTAAHPGLRMHPSSAEVDEPSDATDERSSAFRPLSTYYEDNVEDSTEADDTFSPSDDPVMPEESIAGYTENRQSADRDDEYEPAAEHPPTDDEVAMGMNEMAMAVREEVAAATRETRAKESYERSKQIEKPKRKKLFRTLFSGMRGD